LHIPSLNHCIKNYIGNQTLLLKFKITGDAGCHPANGIFARKNFSDQMCVSPARAPRWNWTKSDHLEFQRSLIFELPDLLENFSHSWSMGWGDTDILLFPCHIGPALWTLGFVTGNSQMVGNFIAAIRADADAAGTRSGTSSHSPSSSSVHRSLCS
jgi:hypothetical protein